MARLYFAYGSNMSPVQMRSRCPGVQPVTTGRLDGWRFYVNRRGTASIKPDLNASVHGVLWRVRPDHVTALDVYEGMRRKHYFKRELRVVTPRGTLRGFTYVGAHLGEGKPVRAYLAGVVVPAARHWELPDDYIDELEAWFRVPPVGPSRPRVAGKSWKP